LLFNPQNADLFALANILLYQVGKLKGKVCIYDVTTMIASHADFYQLFNLAVLLLIKHDSSVCLAG